MYKIVPCVPVVSITAESVLDKETNFKNFYS